MMKKWFYLLDCIHRKHTIPKQRLKSRVPVPKAKSAIKQKLQKDSLINQSVKSTGSQEIINMGKDTKKNQHHAVESIAFEEKGKIYKDGKINQSKGEKIARDILADKVWVFPYIYITCFRSYFWGSRIYSSFITSGIEVNR